VVLKAIFEDRVTLSRNGALEILRLDKNQAGADAPDETPPAPQVAATGDPQTLGEIRAELLSNPAKTTDYIRVMPQAGPGGAGQTGYRIYPGRNNAIFAKSGLRPGDLVTAVNGTQLDDPAKSLQLLSQLSSAGSVTVTVLRGNHPETVNVSLQ